MSIESIHIQYARRGERVKTELLCNEVEKLTLRE